MDCIVVFVDICLLNSIGLFVGAAAAIIRGFIVAG
jgi:hypothetical protein